MIRWASTCLTLPGTSAEDIIGQKFNNLFDQWWKLTDEALSKLTEPHEIGDTAFLEKAAIPTQVRSVR